MSDARRADDSFYRKVLGSPGIQPRQDVDWATEHALILSAGLADEVQGWLHLYQQMRADPALVGVGFGPANLSLAIALQSTDPG